MNLLQAGKGNTVVLQEVMGDRAFRRRLLEMGFVPGTTVKIINVAPLGDPLEVEVRFGNISIRKEEARHLLVKANT